MGGGPHGQDEEQYPPAPDAAFPGSSACGRGSDAPGRSHLMGAVMQVRNIVLGLAAVSLLSGCSIFDRKQVDYKAGAIQTQPLEVPPDLTVPESEQRYTIPGTDGAKVASYSEYTRKTAEQQPCVAPASAPVVATPAPAAGARIQESNGTKSILLGE